MKKKLVTTLLCGFLGGFGIHRFYLGKFGTGIIWLLTGGCCGVGTLIDMIKLARNTLLDSTGQPLVADCPNWVPWAFLAWYALTLIIAVGTIIFSWGMILLSLGLGNM